MYVVFVNVRTTKAKIILHLDERMAHFHSCTFCVQNFKNAQNGPIYALDYFLCG